MVVKRQCSFCADEIEPGTGTMFVKRDGSIFHFCSSSCRKQQLHLGRVGHRLKWTRAHAIKVAAEQSHAAAAAKPESSTKPTARAPAPGRARARRSAPAPESGPETPKPAETAAVPPPKAAEDKEAGEEPAAKPKPKAAKGKSTAPKSGSG